MIEPMFEPWARIIAPRIVAEARRLATATTTSKKS